MNLRHGQLWQRLGLTVLSGILVASLAPATAAAPAGGQDTHGDMESADLSQSSTDSGVAAPVASQDRAASDGADASDASDSAESADSADKATASSEEERASTRRSTPSPARTAPPAFIFSRPRVLRTPSCSSLEASSP